MGQRFRLIALDMDGTLLNSGKAVTERSANAVNAALAAGYQVVLNTGRCPAELAEYYPLFPRLRYVNCISGALVYDLLEGRTMASVEMDPPLVRAILEIAAQEDAMMQLLSEKSYVEREKERDMARYHMGVYQEMYDRVTTRVDRLKTYYESEKVPVEKFNIYHMSAAARARTRRRIEAAGLSVTLADAEATALEISPQGVSKAFGLKRLCEGLGVDTSEVVVVGDADNDLSALEMAGLAVAMGNATAAVKRASDWVVADCDHDGCAEAIERVMRMGGGAESE